MLFEFKLPDLGEGVAEGEVVAWHVEPGQLVHEDQDMVEVMTDKATVTIGAPRAGRVAQLNASVGERVHVGTVLIVIDTAAGAESGERRPRSSESDTARSRFQAPARGHGKLHGASKRVEAVTASAVGDLRETLPGASFFSRSTSEPEGVNGSHAASIPSVPSTKPPEPSAEPRPDTKPLATPATRKLARDLGIDLRSVVPSGPHGRVTKHDLSALPRPESTGAVRPREYRRPFVGLRRRIAERMQMAKQKAAHFTFVEEVDVGALKELVERAKKVAEERQIKLHYLPFVIKAVTLALKKHELLNSTLDEQANELVYRNYYHIGVATATDQGLVVPVVRDADQKSVLDIARDVQRLAEGARAGRLSAAELSGSTFTVTSLGRMGGLLATPVLNYPEVGIVGVHRVKERPVVRHGQIVVGHVMLLSMTFDHRIIDGHVGAAFAYEVIAYLERPELLLLELS